MLTFLAQSIEPHFFSTEHIHVLLNHIPIIGLGAATLGLAIALIQKSRPAEIVALILVFLTSALAWPVNVTGTRSYENIQDISDKNGIAWLDEHMHRAEKTEPAFYVLAALALAALLVPRKWPRATTPLTLLTLLLAIACTAAGGWIALAGGRVRHPEFRTSQIPPAESPNHQHTHP
jgi:hypothetical protein